MSSPHSHRVQIVLVIFLLLVGVSCSDGSDQAEEQTQAQIAIFCDALTRPLELNELERGQLLPESVALDVEIGQSQEASPTERIPVPPMTLFEIVATSPSQVASTVFMNPDSSQEQIDAVAGELDEVGLPYFFVDRVAALEEFRVLVSATMDMEASDMPPSFRIPYPIAPDSVEVAEDFRDNDGVFEVVSRHRTSVLIHRSITHELLNRTEAGQALTDASLNATNDVETLLMTLRQDSEPRADRDHVAVQRSYLAVEDLRDEISARCDWTFDLNDPSGGMYRLSEELLWPS